MTWTCQSLFALSCLFLTVKPQTGQVPEPQNVKLRWNNDFEPELSWEPAGHAWENCTYDVWKSTKSTNKMDGEITTVTSPPWKWSSYVVMEGGFLHLSVETVCNERHSPAVNCDIKNRALVSNLNCYMRSGKQTHCSWIPASHAPDLGFFYKLVNEDGTSSAPSPLQECSRNILTNGTRTGCELQANVTQAIHILFNRTLNNTLVRNTFRIWLKYNVRPFPLNWTVTKAEETFEISWIPPDIGDLEQWRFNISYTECNEQKSVEVLHKTSHKLPRNPDCQYSMAIQAKREETDGRSDWSRREYFDKDPSWFVYVAIIIPLMFASLALLIFVCCRKNKDIIFPKVPEPRDFLSDISDNNNKIAVRNLYIPAEEEECKITLVIDPLNNKIHS